MNAPNVVLMGSSYGITQSESIKEISKALHSVQSQMMAVGKDASNPAYRGSKYATLLAVWSTLQPLMKESGLVVMQTGGDSKQVEIKRLIEPAKNDQEKVYQEFSKTIMLMDFITRVTHSETGEWIQSVGSIPFEKFDPQGFGSAMTYARRYCLSALMGIVVDDDDDGNAGSGKGNPPQNQNRNGSQPPQQRQQQRQQGPPPNQQQQRQQQAPTGQQQQPPPNQAPPNQPPAGQPPQQQTAIQRLGTFLKKADCNGKEDADLLIDFIAPSHNWQTVQKEEIAQFVLTQVNEGVTAGRFATETVLQTAKAAKDASAEFK